MKNILLTTTALVAFAGAAAAGGHTSVSFSGDATLGYNDDVEDGFFWNTDLDVSASAALDNGVTATAAFGFEITEDTLGETVVSENFVLSIGNDTASLSFGDLDPVAEGNFSDVDGGTTAGFFDQDAHFDVVGFASMLVGEANLGGVTAMVSYGVLGNNPALLADVDQVDAMQLFATGTFGMFSVQGAYQGEFAGIDARMGVSASTSFAGADVSASYMDDGTENSIGFGASYPIGAVTVGGYYSVNDVAENNYGVSASYADGPVAVNAYYEVTGAAVGDDATEMGIEGSYEVMSGLTVLAGYIDFDTDDSARTYVAGTYDLGGGAEILVSYAEDEANAINDEIGDPEYNHGTTVQVSFSF